MSCLVEEVKDEILLGKKRRASALAAASISASFASSSSSSFSSSSTSTSTLSNSVSSPSDKIKTDISDYLAVSACMKMLEYVLHSGGGVDEHKFTIWSSFKALDSYPTNNLIIFLL